MKLALLTVIAAFLLTEPVSAAQPQLTGWDGTNPFKCVLQQAGLGPTGPDPGADPYCIEFDKRHQNVNNLGIVDFLSKEPGRVAVASPKCFYFQSDHWRSEVVEGDGSTTVYTWDGHYYYDKARGTGGVWVTNFAINGHSADPSQAPGMPPEYAQHMSNGTGGVTLVNDVPVDPNCVARAKSNAASIYASQSGSGRGGAKSGGPCVRARGRLHRRTFGPVRLGTREASVRARFGVPIDVRSGYLRYCVRGGGSLLIGERSPGSGLLGGTQADRVAIVISSSRAFRHGGLRPGARAHHLRHARLVARFRKGLRVWRIGGRRSTLLVATRRGRIRWVAIYDRSAIRSRRALRALIARAV